MGKAIKDKVETPTAEEIKNVEVEKPKEEPKAEAEEGEWLVETPNPSYTGLNVTIEFKNGKGTTKNKVVAEHFEAKGYKVTKL